MININLTIIVFFTIMLGNVWAASKVHYDIDFSSPIHAVESLPTIGFSTNTISSIIFGEPTVETSFGSLTNQPLVFNPNIHNYEQIMLDLGSDYDNYIISFDIETKNLVESQCSFSILLDTPTVQVLSFKGYSGIILYNTSHTQPYIYETIGNFTDNTLISVIIAVDLKYNLWSIHINDNMHYQGYFYAEENDVGAIRFNLATPYESESQFPSVFVGIDNVVVKSIEPPLPVPKPVWLFPILNLLGASNDLLEN